VPRRSREGVLGRPRRARDHLADLLFIVPFYAVLAIAEGS
jgi:hypothetical protein